MADLLSPVAAGTAAETATSGEAWLRALLDAEAALARAQARLGVIPDGVAGAIAGADIDLDTTVPEWALGYQWDIVLGATPAED